MARIKSTKQDSGISYPCIVEITKAMGQKRKSPVIRAIEYNTKQDLSDRIVYPTLRNAYIAGMDLIKESIDSKWTRISKQDSAARLADPAAVAEVEQP